MMSKDLEQTMADSMETEKAVLPYLPALLTDLWALGGSPDIVADMFRPLHLPPESRVLDLGCGKGGICIPLAAELGLRVLGVDASRAFLDTAAEQAARHGVTERCEFRREDIRETVQRERDFDGVILASLGAVLGDFRETAGLLRQTVRSGGYMLIDDGFLKPGKKTARKGYAHYGSREETVACLTSHGDMLIKEVVLADKTTAAINRGYLQAMKKRAPEIKSGAPQMAGKIDRYIRRQEAECEFIDKYLKSAIWLLRKKRD